jgi:hypothetical protein
MAAARSTSAEMMDFGLLNSLGGGGVVACFLLEKFYFIFGFAAGQ